VAPNGIAVSVRDSGTGIAAKDARRIFDPFYTTKSHGMGMGLSICKSIVEQHHGTLTAASIKSRGAIFQIVMPRAA
jgi:signal transduction histidine kinase